jgi:3-dehydroquinate dehydratase / shikimate dehydrogenase
MGVLCITSADRTYTALRERIRRHKKADLQEVRLDYLEGFSGSLDLDADPGRLIITCRPTREGGLFDGSEEDRLSLVSRCLESKPGWIDIEYSTEQKKREWIIEKAHRMGVQVLVSCHDFEQGAAARSIECLNQLAKVGGDAIKLAVSIEDAAELNHLFRAGQESDVPLVLVGMGAAGLLSRAWYTRFGSIWTYVADEVGCETSSGQLSYDQFQAWRLPPGPTTDLYVLLGGKQVMESPGPRVYNALFSARSIDARYLPVVTEMPEETLELLKRIGIKGASVTMPLKQKLLSQMDFISEEAAEASALNTITVSQDGLLSGDLTDGLGALALLEKESGSVNGKRIVILGNGGTAAAVTQALVQAGARATVLGRDQNKAALLADKFQADSGHLHDLAAIEFDVLINTTPVGNLASSATLVEDKNLLNGKIVLDTVLGRETRLTRDARQAGGIALSGRQLWAEQGRLQLAGWFDLDLTAASLEIDP